MRCIRHHAMKIFRIVEVQLHIFFTSTLAEDKRSCPLPLNSAGEESLVPVVLRPGLDPVGRTACRDSL